MAKPIEAIRFWAYPATVVALWVVVAAFSISQLATVIPPLTSPALVQRQPQDHRPKGCVDVC